jgi:hypothetical protein
MLVFFYQDPDETKCNFASCFVLQPFVFGDGFEAIISFIFIALNTIQVKKARSDSIVQFLQLTF